jgi:hypothetical protein
MKDEITQEQIELYREQGYLPIIEFFDADERKAWRDATEEAVQKRLSALKTGLESGEVKKSFTSKIKAPMVNMLGEKGAQNARDALRAVLGEKIVPKGFNGVLNTNQGDADSYYAKVYVQCIRLHAESEAMRKLVLDPRIGKVAATLAGVDGMRLYHDQALFKPAQGNPTAWHLDNPFWSFHSPQAMTMWIAIEDATLGNGCMWYVPGSHKTASVDKNLNIGADFAGLFKMYPEWKNIEPKSAACPAGSVVFHNGLTAHAAGVNLTNKPRRAFAVAFMPEGSKFNGRQDVLSAEYFKTLKVGDELNDDVVHPLLWSKHSKNGVKAEAAMAV